MSEGLLSVTPNVNDHSRARKTVTYPIRLIGGSSGGSSRGVRRDLENLNEPSDRDWWVASLISHEVGHSLGFDHDLEAVPGGGYVLMPHNADLCRSIMGWESLGPFTFIRRLFFGPVHRAAVDRDFRV